ncbi:MAG: cytochrome c oxidase subunit 3 [Alphaproteobacteria bacterium]|jgi:cytochrome c oxidase subunit 3|nr:cytochrome c oxidase subunit 3 [Alphaproteobacteria bacterium]MBN9558700.1 cytochrome c oxidase subunit 3 [Alphaproteobacteria bacterium]MBN9566798.1 cytochrome c oxidase subunit 3 [Alphaproteobacteria bacterium]MBN9578687.1 cytochrome c oxidase subunit 3 [Alphaproteobacteria bacterium]
MAHGEVKHDYHLVDPSPWPLIGSIGAFVMFVGAVFWMNDGAQFWGLPVSGQPWIFVVGVLLVLYTMAGWWRDVIKESVVKGNHTPVVKLHLRYGMVLFITSEVMFFVAWFWAYFNSAIFFHDVSIGSWPPAGIVTLDPWHLPLLNTLILLCSATTVTWAHHALQLGDRKGAIQGLVLTVLLGATFTALQAFEYAHAPFTFGFNNLALQPFSDPAHINLATGAGNFDAIYGSTFFMATGFHGFHVIVGTIFLAVCLARAIAGQFTPTRHFGFEAAAWYWHFVDVVWLFLFACIYVWGQGPISH